MKPALLLSLLLLSLPLPAQQSATAELDACIRDEQRSKARKGAVLGFLGGLLESVSGARQEQNQSQSGASIRIGLSSAGGGALGLTLAYYTAVDTCLQRNPQWIPASRLERDADYAAAVGRHGYVPEQGPLLRLLGIEGPSQAQAGSELALQGRLLLLTPQGEEARLQIERRLYVRAEGQEQELRYLGHAQEQRVLSPGEHLDRARLPLPKELPAGVEFRYQLRVGLEGQAPMELVHTVVSQ